MSQGKLEIDGFEPCQTLIELSEIVSASSLDPEANLNSLEERYCIVYNLRKREFVTTN